jgi:hypothetical protein
MGMGFPIAKMVSSSGQEPAILPFLTWTFHQAKMAAPLYVMVDADKAESNAIRAFGSTPVICYFHFCQALRKHLDMTTGGLPDVAHDEFWALVKEGSCWFYYIFLDTVTLHT